MNEQFKAGMMKAAEMVNQHAIFHRTSKQAAKSTHVKAMHQDLECVLTEMSLAILTACQEENIGEVES